MRSLFRSTVDHARRYGVRALARCRAVLGRAYRYAHDRCLHVIHDRNTREIYIGWAALIGYHAAWVLLGALIF